MSLVIDSSEKKCFLLYVPIVICEQSKLFFYVLSQYVIRLCIM